MSISGVSSPAASAVALQPLKLVPINGAAPAGAGQQSGKAEHRHHTPAAPPAAGAPQFSASEPAASAGGASTSLSKIA